jgi:hypothetical protein
VPLSQPPADLDGFPSHVVPPFSSLFRVHRRERSPWWYSRDGSGRFDLTFDGHRGTCYFAEEELGSFVEVFRDTVPIAPMAIQERCMSECSFSSELTLADCTSRLARGFGITAAVHATADYAQSQAWAWALALAGFDGIRYFVSHDPAQDLRGVALFGAIGAVPGRSETRDLDSQILASAERQFGLRVLPIIAEELPRPHE